MSNLIARSFFSCSDRSKFVAGVVFSDETRLKFEDTLFDTRTEAREAARTKIEAFDANEQTTAYPHVADLAFDEHGDDDSESFDRDDAVEDIDGTGDPLDD